LANQSVEAGTLHRCSADETGQRRLLRIARHEVGGHRLPALHRWLPHRRPERTQGTLRRFDMPGAIMATSGYAPGCLPKDVLQAA
jgi:hypothetical protein